MQTGLEKLNSVKIEQIKGQFACRHNYVLLLSGDIRSP
jgi:hypothetical protein